jgi:hypothetical protein
MDGAVSVRSLLGRSVRLGNVTIGHVHDVVLARTLGHVLGIVIGRRGGREWFVPWIGIAVTPHALHIGSTLLVLPPPGSGGYDHRGRSVRELLAGSDLDDGSRVTDIHVTEDGDVTTVIRVDGSIGEPRQRGSLATALPTERVATA